MLVGVVARAYEWARGDVVEAERVSGLLLLAERLRRPDGLDRDTLERIEELAGDEQ